MTPLNIITLGSNMIAAYYGERCMRACGLRMFSITECVPGPLLWNAVSELV